MTQPATAIVNLSENDIDLTSGFSPLQYEKSYTTPGNYKINCSYPGNSNYTQASVNYTIEAVDEIKPTVTLEQPPIDYANDTGRVLNITFNCTATDNYNLKNISLWLTNSYNQSLSINQTKLISGTSNSSNWTMSLGKGDYTWNCLAYDQYDNFIWGTERALYLNFTNYPPTHTTPLLTSTYNVNTTNEDLLCYNQSTADVENEPIKNIYDWTVGGSTILLTLAPFEGGSNNTWTRDYSGSLGYNLAANADWNATAGYDGFGAYEFDGVNDYIYLDNSADTSTIFDATITTRTIILRYKANSVAGTTYRMLFEEGGTTNGADIYIYDSDIYIGAWSEGSTPIWNGNWTIFSTTADEWHIAALVFDAPNNRMGGYHDGTLTWIYNSDITEIAGHTGDEALGRTEDNTVAYPNSGSDRSATGDYFNGTIDEFMVFSTVLSEDQLDAMYNNLTNVIVSNETSLGETWQCKVTPNDGNQDGTTLLSNQLTITTDIPIASVTNLANQSQSDSWIYWNWTNPTDGDFNTSIIYINGTWQENTTNNFFNATGLVPETSYTITAHTQDQFGNINNTDQNNTAATITFTIPPVINSVNATPNPVERLQNITITANVTDDTSVSLAWFELEGINYTMNQYGDIWNLTLNTTTSLPGNYNYTVYANDSDNNLADALKGNFTVQDSIPTSSVTGLANQT
ncbi:hypothetical protein ACFLYT_01900, partial [Nanoarchaeota archaeon]